VGQQQTFVVTANLRSRSDVRICFYPLLANGFLPHELTPSHRMCLVPTRRLTTAAREGRLSAFDRRRVMNSADVADAMERTRESIDESRQLMADVPESIVRWITAALEPRRPRHCWSASVCRPDSPPNLLIEILRC